MINGGVCPGGIERSNVWQMAVICATPASTDAPGCRNTLMTLMPLYAVDSMCSMSLTVVVSGRSQLYMIRCSTSCALSPPYCQMTLTTGMLMDGKISVGVHSRINGVNSRSNSAATTNVYGRRNARRTIHMASFREPTSL